MTDISVVGPSTLMPRIVHGLCLLIRDRAEIGIGKRLHFLEPQPHLPSWGSPRHARIRWAACFVAGIESPGGKIETIPGVVHPRDWLGRVRSAAAGIVSE